MFIGRERELNELEQLYCEDRFQLFVLYGRRRVGKTTLLTQFCKGKDAIFYSAEQSNMKANLDKFSKLVFEFYGETNLENFTSWDKALGYLSERQGSKKLVVVLDEFPYLAEKNPEILSSMQHLIDHQLKDSRLFLVLCGSYMGFMEKSVLGVKSPLFGRRTGQLQMKTFDYAMSAGFLSEFSDEDKLMLYGAFGGTPMYLQQIRGEVGVKENIERLFLSTTGYLYEEPMLLMRQELQDPAVYNAIIETIATGATKANEIATKTGEDTAKCIKYIGTLKELGIVYSEHPFGEKENSRKTLYGISDLMFRFWHRYVSGNKTLIESGASEAVWSRKIEPDYSDYMGGAFERVCKEYLLRENSKGNLPLLFTTIGRWWGNDSKAKKQVEIDLVAQDGNTYLFGECKWRNERLDIGVLQGLQYKAEVFGTKTADKIYYALFSKSGFTKAVVDRARDDDSILLISLEDIMAI